MFRFVFSACALSSWVWLMPSGACAQSLAGEPVAPAEAAERVPVAPATANGAPSLAASAAASSVRAEVAPTEVVVRGTSAAARLRASALAVEVVELGPLKRSSADLGEVLARTTSLRVQREGGLGSSARYSLNGLAGDRVRFFLDGVPLEYSPYQFGVANVPLGLVERAEVYQGVVPVRFAADALGGAVNLVTEEQRRSSKLGAAYEFASFDTHRVSAAGRYFFEEARGLARISAFHDRSRNDYPVGVRVSDDSGQVSDARLLRFHDGYRAVGGSLAAGIVDRALADRLVLQGYFGDYRREVQNNIAMTVPYGEVEYTRAAFGADLNHAKRWGTFARVETALGYAQRKTGFRDLSRCRYDWFGRCVVENPLAGEIDSIAIDRDITARTVFLRTQLTLRPLPEHTLRLALAPSFTERSGQDRKIAERDYDPARAPRRMFGGVFGAEYEVAAGRLASLTFAKLYGQYASAEELFEGREQRLSHEQTLFGAGDSMRFKVTDEAYLKASYEYAARLPNADERFGDGGSIVSNLDIEAERGHNYNLGAYLDDAKVPFGRVHAKLSGALRQVEALIRLVGSGSYSTYQNVNGARALGFDAALGWSALSEAFGFDTSFGYQDVRNTSDTGGDVDWKGDRIPNEPYLQAGGSAYLRAQALRTARDRLELVWNVRHVRRFLLAPEGRAVNAPRLDVPNQTTHSLLLGYDAPEATNTLGVSFEVKNLTDAKVYDFYGVERPGRSFHFKVTCEYQ